MNLQSTNQSLAAYQKSQQIIKTELDTIFEALDKDFNLSGTKGALVRGKSLVMNELPERAFKNAIRVNGLENKKVPVRYEEELEFETLDIEAFGNSLIEQWKQKASDYPKHEAAKVIYDAFIEDINKSYSTKFDEDTNTYTFSIDLRKSSDSETGYVIEWEKINLKHVAEAFAVFAEDNQFDYIDDIIKELVKRHSFAMEFIGQKVKAGKATFGSKGFKLTLELQGGLVEALEQYVEQYKGDKSHF